MGSFLFFISILFVNFKPLLDHDSKEVTRNMALICPVDNLGTSLIHKVQEVP